MPRVRVALCAAMLGLSTASQAKDPMHVYTMQPGDNLINLGERLLRNPSTWRELARINHVSEPRQMPVGKQIDIPLYLLKSRTVSAAVTALSGQATIAGPGQRKSPLHVGDLFDLREEIHTGSDGFVTVRLADESLIRIRPSSIVRLERAQHFEAAGFFKTKLNLLQGRVDSLVKRSSKASPSLEIQTPQTIMGVRGTAFRTTAGLNGLALSAAEVLEGTVMAGTDTPVNGGSGVLVDTTGTPKVDKLLPAPEWLPAAKAVQERLLVRLPVSPVKDAQNYRAQIAADAGFDHIVAEAVSATPDFRFTDVPDGSYHMRVRAISAQGLEGVDATASLVVKARPEPPALMAPSSKAKLRSNRVAFRWAEQAEASTYRLQVAPAQAAWTAAVVDRKAESATTLTSALPEGDYQWRIASVRANGDQGPWSDAQTFVLRPPPADISPPAITKDRMVLRWPSEPGQTFDFQIANEPTFQSPWFNQHLLQAQAELAVPEKGGRLFIRYRAIDSDGFIGPFTGAQKVELPTCLRDGQDQCARASSGLAIQGP